MNKFNLVARLLLILVVGLASLWAKAEVIGDFDGKIRDLIKTKLADETLYIELTFESNSRAEKIRNYNQAINEIVLLNFSPIYSNFKIKVKADEYIETINGRFTAYKNIPVAARQLSVGTIISSSDIVENLVRINKIKSGIVTSKDKAIGMQVKKNIPSNSQIRDVDISKPHIVRDKDEVTMIYRNKNIELSAPGIVVEGGALGDYIRVKNAATGKLVHARVMSPNLVQINEDR